MVHAPGKQSTNVDISRHNVDDQADFASALANRVRERAMALNMLPNSLAKALGLPTSSVNNYWHGKRPWPTRELPALADALRTNVDFLLRGVNSAAQLVAADEAEWIAVPEFDLGQLEDGNKGPVVSETPFRRDWLRRTLGSLKGIWLARLPAEYTPLGLAEGDLVFLRDADPDEPRDRAHYIVRIDGILTVARVDALAESGIMRSGDRVGDQVLAFRHFAQEDSRPILVARLLGVPFKRV